MKAWRVETHGGPEVLKRLEITKPELKPMEVRVRVQAVGLNHLDIWVRKGVPGHSFPLPLTPGADVSGTIDQLGSGADELLGRDGLKVGSPVVLNPGVSCGRCEACLSGFDPLCRFYGILGEMRDGGCADYIVVPAANVIARPPQLSPSEAAALPIPYLTAWTMLMKKAMLKPGEIILIQAGGSGVSVAAIQMAKLIGATVITTVSTEHKAERAQQLGADHVILRKTKADAFQNPEVKKAYSSYGRKGCDVVLDHVGADTFQESLKSLAWGGRLVTCGATSGANVEMDLKMVFFKNLSILGSTMGSKADFLQVLRLVADRKLKPIIDSTYPMHDLPLAFAKLESRTAFGKVVVTVV